MIRGSPRRRDAVLDRVFMDDAADFDGMMVDYLCADCGRRTTVPASQAKPPVCCDWEMVCLVPTVRPAPVSGVG
jgi:hypothetical protein